MESTMSDKEQSTTEQQLATPHLCGITLTSGEDIICILKLETDKNRYLMSNPALVLMKPSDTEEGKFQIVFSPYVPAAHSGQVSIKINSVVALYAPQEIIGDQYRAIFRHPGLVDMVPKEEPKEEKPSFKG